MEIKCAKCGSVRLYAQTPALRESFQVPRGKWREKGYLNMAGNAHVWCLDCFDEWYMNITLEPNRDRNDLRWVAKFIGEAMKYPNQAKSWLPKALDIIKKLREKKETRYLTTERRTIQ